VHSYSDWAYSFDWKWKYIAYRSSSTLSSCAKVINFGGRALKCDNLRTVMVSFKLLSAQPNSSMMEPACYRDVQRKLLCAGVLWL